MKTISKQEAAEMIRGTNGKLFGVTFIKRSTGSKRRMTARLGVSKGVTGEGQKFNPRDHDLITVHEFVTDPNTSRDEKGHFSGAGSMATHFRNIAIEGITEVRIGGKIFQVN
jgi:hypothetical protein